MFRSYCLHIRPNKTQVAALDAILSDCCETYNAALQERREAWKLCRKQIGYYDQTKQITELRKDKRFTSIAVDIQRDPLRRVDKAFAAFFRRCRAGEKAGYPRFRSRKRYDSFTFGRVSIRDHRIRIPNCGDIRFTISQDIRGNPRTATVKRYGKRWIIRITCDIGIAPVRQLPSRPIGVDVGLNSFITLSDGSYVENARWTKRHEDRIARANRSLSRKQRRSKNHLKAREIVRRAHQRAADARKNFLHHISKYLISNYDLIAFEKLDIRHMTQGRIAKSILDAAWAELTWQITYKAERAGKWAIPVNPKGTSIRCSACNADVVKTLDDRRHVCPCGASLDRDHNAALNILALGMSAAGLDPSERVPYTSPTPFGFPKSEFCTAKA